MRLLVVGDHVYRFTNKQYRAWLEGWPRTLPAEVGAKDLGPVEITGAWTRDTVEAELEQT